MEEIPAEPIERDVLFQEEQRFSSLWIWAGVLFAPIVLTYGVVLQIGFGIPFGDDPVSDVVLLGLWIVFGIGFPLLIYRTGLMTVVTTDGLYVRFFPFHRKWRRFGARDISSAEARAYRPIAEYGGWGIRLGLKGWAYNVKGGEGVQLTFRNGRPLLIGSQHAGELEQALNKTMSRSVQG